MSSSMFFHKFSSSSLFHFLKLVAIVKVTVNHMASILCWIRNNSISAVVWHILTKYKGNFEVSQSFLVQNLVKARLFAKACMKGFTWY